MGAAELWGLPCTPSVEDSFFFPVECRMHGMEAVGISISGHEDLNEYVRMTTRHRRGSVYPPVSLLRGFSSKKYPEGFSFGEVGSRIRFLTF